MRSILLNQRGAQFTWRQMLTFGMVCALLGMVISSFALTSNALKNPGFEYGTGTNANDWTETSASRTADCGRNGTGDWCMQVTPVITNPSFEDGTCTDDVAPNGWTASAPNYMGCTSGGYDGTNRIYIQKATYVYQQITVTANVLYTFSVWADARTAGNPATLKIGTSANSSNLCSASTTINSWTKISCDATPSSSSVYITLADSVDDWNDSSSFDLVEITKIVVIEQSADNVSWSILPNCTITIGSFTTSYQKFSSPICAMSNNYARVRIGFSGSNAVSSSYSTSSYTTIAVLGYIKSASSNWYWDDIQLTGFLIRNNSNPYGYIGDSKSYAIEGKGFGTYSSGDKVELCSTTECTTAQIQCQYGGVECTTWNDTNISFTSENGSLSDGTIYLRVWTSGGETEYITLVLDTKIPVISGVSTQDEGDNYGILTNMASPPVSPSGWATGCKLQGCMKFDGTNDYINIGDKLDFTYTSTFTIEAWIQKAADETAGKAIIAKSNSTNDGWNLWIGADDKIKFILSVSSSNRIERNTATTYITSGTCISSVCHVLVTYDGSTSANGLHIYVNGGSDDGTATTTTPSGTIDTTYSTTIGARQSGASWWYGQTIDEIAIWNNVLNSSAIAARYNSGNGKELVGNESNLVAVWHFNEAKGILANDTKRTTLEGATVYKYDPIYIDLGTVNGVNGNIQETCLHARWFDSITIKDATGPDDITSTTMFYDEATGRIKLQAPDAGWPTTDNPLKINISTSLLDCAENVLASSYVMTTGITVSSQYSTAYSANSILISTAGDLSFRLGRKLLYDGYAYYLFWTDGTKIKYAISIDAKIWPIMTLSGLDGPSDGATFNVNINVTEYKTIHVCVYNRCKAYRVDFDDSRVLVEMETTEMNMDTDCDTYTTSAGAPSIEQFYDTTFMVYVVSTNLKTCNTPTADAYAGAINFSGASTQLDTGVGGSRTELIYENVSTYPMGKGFVFYSKGTSLYTIRYDGSWGSVVEVATGLSAGEQWSAASSATYMHVVYRKSDGSCYHKQRLKGASGTWSSETLLTGCGTSRHTLTASYINKDGLILFLSNNEASISYMEYDGSSWGGETLLVSTSGCGYASCNPSYSFTSSPIEGENVGVVYSMANGTNYDIRFSVLGKDYTQNYTDGIAVTKRGWRGGTPMPIKMNKYVASFLNGTIITGVNRNMSPYSRFMDNLSMVFSGIYYLSYDPVNLLDTHVAPTIGIDINGYVSIIYGGRGGASVPIYDGKYSALQIRESLLPISDGNWKNYMWGPAKDTKLAPPCYRGYKWVVVDSNNISHIVCGESSVYYIADIETNTPVLIIDASCASNINEKLYVHSVEIASNNDIGITWSVSDQNNPSGGKDLYFTRLTYADGTYTGKRGDKSSLTLPHIPNETGCTARNDVVYVGDRAIGPVVMERSTTGGLKFTEDSYPLIAFLVSSTPTESVQTLKFSRCIVSSCTWSLINLNDTTPLVRVVHKPGSQVINLLFSYNKEIRRRKSTDLGVTFNVTETILSDNNYSFFMSDGEDGGTRDYLVLFSNSMNTSSSDYVNRLWQEQYIKYIDLDSFPIIYRIILGD